MQTREFTILALRLLAVYVALYGLLSVAEFLPIWWQQNELWHQNKPIVAIAALLLGPLIVSIALWFAAPKLSHFATAGLSPRIAIGELNATSLTASAFIVVGVVVLLFNVPSLIAATIHSLSATQPFQFTWLLSTSLKCVLAFVLIVGARGIASFLLKIRTAGLRDTDL